MKQLPQGESNSAAKVLANGKISQRSAGLAAFVILFAIALNIFLGLVPSAQAQTSGRATLSQTLDAKVAEAEAYLEERLTKRLEAVTDPPFLTTVKVEFPVSKLNTLRQSAGGNVSKLSRGALAKGISNDDALISLLNALTPLEILANAQRVSVVVTLDQTYPKDSVADLKNTLFAYLRLNAKRGDKLGVNQKDLTAGRSKSKVEKAEKESLQYKSQIDSLQREIEAIRRRESDAQREVNEAKRKEQDAQTQLREALKATDDAKLKQREEQDKTNKAEEERRKLSTEIDDLKKQIADLNQKNKDLTEDSKSPVGKFKKLIAGLELPLTVVPAVLLGLVGILVIVLIQTSRVKSASTDMSATMMQVSTAVAKIGESIVQAAKVQGKQQGDAINVSAGGAGALQQQGMQSSGDSTSEELIALEKEAQSLIAEMNQSRYPMLSVLKDWLADKRERTKFAGFAEAVGPNASREIFKVFPKEEIEALGNALYEPLAKAQAYKVVLQLYRLAGREISRKPSYFVNLDMSFLIKATDLDLSAALSDSGTAEAARLMVLLTPERCARIIPGVRNHDSMELLEAMREATEMSEDDAKAALDDVKGRINSDSGGDSRFDVTNHLMLMLDAPSPEFRTAVSKVLRADKQLSQQVGSRVVTIEEVLRLDDETLAELLAELEPVDVATLLVSLPEELNDRINEFFTSAKIQAAIRQELEKFERSKMARKRAEFEGQKIQASLIRQVKDMREQGLIELAGDGGDGEDAEAS
ncbi:MAG: FliG C-terminal domain-containing protein [Silvanigrellaceae bacterium]